MRHSAIFPAFRRAATLLAGGLLLAASPAFATDYVQAPGSTLAFATEYDGEVFSGHFSRFTTTASFDPQHPEAARLDVVIPLASAGTANPDRDQTLLGADFFNVGKFPQARYSATGFRPLGDGNYAADGTLTLRGVSHPVTLTFSWTDGASPVLAGKATVQRLAFNVGGGDWADVSLIPDAVAVSTKVNLQPVE